MYYMLLNILHSQIKHLFSIQSKKVNPAHVNSQSLCNGCLVIPLHTGIRHNMITYSGCEPLFHWFTAILLQLYSRTEPCFGASPHKAWSGFHYQQKAGLAILWLQNLFSVRSLKGFTLVCTDSKAHLLPIIIHSLGLQPCLMHIYKHIYFLSCVLTYSRPACLSAMFAGFTREI